MDLLDEVYARAGDSLAAWGAELAGDPAAGARLRDDAVVHVLGAWWPRRGVARTERRIRAAMARRCVPVEEAGVAVVPVGRR